MMIMMMMCTSLSLQPIVVHCMGVGYGLGWVRYFVGWVSEMDPWTILLYTLSGKRPTIFRE